MDKPVRLTGLAALRWGSRFVRDPLIATRDCLETLGPFVVLADALPLIKPRGVPLFGVPLVLTAGAAFQRELLSDPAMWRGVSLLPGGPRNSAARRMSAGLTRMTGPWHAHYRRVIAPPLRKPSVDALTQSMARLAEAEVASWRAGEAGDLWDNPRRLMRRLAVELLFDGSEQAYRISDAVSRLMERKWGASARVAINLPITPYGRINREAAALERIMLDWIASKRGQPDGGDLASLMVNTPGVDGVLPSDEMVVAQMPSLIAAASEATQSALTFTLLLLAQHPQVARTLLDELYGKLGSTSPALDAVGDLPYLDGVVKEAMRVLPPVPLQMRVALSAATVAGYAVPQRTRVVLNTFLTNREPELYPEPDLFNPQRWAAMAPSAFEWPVFGAGPYSCLGSLFGVIGVKIALAAILTRYRVELPAGTRIDYHVQPVLRPRQQVPILLQRQDGAFAAAPIRGRITKLVRFPQ